MAAILQPKHTRSLKPVLQLGANTVTCVRRLYGIFCITRTVEHNYILPSSTVRIQQHVSALHVDHLQVEMQLTDQLYKMCGVFVWGLGGGNEISLFQ